MKNVVIFHGDADGICSAALITLYLMENDEFPEYFISPDYDVILDSFLIDKIYSLNPDRIFIIDLPSSTLNYNFQKDFETIIVDHHPYDKEPEATRFIHSRDRCTSYLVFNNFKIDDKASWIAAIGCLGDKDMKSFEELKGVSRKFYDLNDKFFLDAMNFIASSRLFKIWGKRSAILSLVEAHRMEIPTAVLGSTPNSQKLERYRKASTKFRNFILSNLPKFSKVNDDNLLVVHFSFKYPIQSYIAGCLSHAFPDKVVVVINEVHNKAFIEARTKEKNVNVGELLKKVCDKLNGIGGGHEKAGGARISNDKVEEFIETLRGEFQ